MASSDDIIRVVDIPFDEHIPIEQLRGPAKKWFREKYRTHDEITNRETGRKIDIRGGGIGHTISNTRSVDVVYSMDVLPEMIERMTYVGSSPPHPPEEGKPIPENFLGVELYRVQVQVREKLYTAEFVVKIERKEKTEVGKIGKVRLYYYNHKFTKGPAERTA